MKKIKNLRVARIIQWTNGGVAWLSVCLVYRIMIPLWRYVKRDRRIRYRSEAHLGAHVTEAPHDRP